MISSVHSATEAKLHSTNGYDQSDAASKIFQEWYAVAKEYAEGHLIGGMEKMIACTGDTFRIMLTTTSESTIIHGQSDEYATRELFEGAGRLCEIFSEKPKFFSIIQSPNARVLFDYLEKTGIPHLESLSFHDMVSANIRIEAFHTIVKILFLSLKVHEVNPRHSHLKVNLPKHNGVANRVGIDTSIRSAAFDVLEASCYKGKTVHPLILGFQHAQDVYSLSRLFQFALLEKLQILNTILEILVQKIRSTTSEGKGRNFVGYVLCSFYEYLVNTTVHVQENESDTSVNLEGICTLVMQCLETLRDKSTTSSHPSHSDDETTPDLLYQTIEILLQRYPNSNRLLLVVIENSSYRMLLMLLGLANIFSEDTWINTLLPFIRNCLCKMSFSGVSGNQYEQQVIYLLQEVCRLYYLDLERNPSSELGHNIFVTVVQAIRHGYIETERFTEIGATIITFHANTASNSSSIQWLPSLFLSTVCHNHKTLRAMSEMILIILGIETSSFGIETSSSVRQNNEESIEKIAIFLADVRTDAADRFWENIYLNHSSFTQQHPLVEETLLTSIHINVNEMILMKEINLLRLHSMADLIRAISLHFSPSMAPILFENTVKAMSIHPSGKTLYSDETLINIINHVPDKENIFPQDCIRAALAAFGPNARRCLAKLVPHLCLLDTDPMVRSVALVALLEREKLIPAHARKILASTDSFNSVVLSEDQSELLQIHEFTIAVSSCPLLAELAILLPDYIDECIIRLVRAAKVSSNNDALHKPLQKIIGCLDRVAIKANRFRLISFLKSRTGLTLLPILSELSETWKSLVRQMEMDSTISRIEVSKFKNEDKKRITFVSCENLPCAIHISPDDEKKYNGIIEMGSSGKLLEAVRIAAKLKTSHPQLYISRQVESYLINAIFPKIALERLPKKHENKFAIHDLKSYGEHMTTMNELKNLFPAETEEYFNISSLIEEFQKAQREFIHESKTFSSALKEKSPKSSTGVPFSFSNLKSLRYSTLFSKKHHQNFDEDHWEKLHLLHEDAKNDTTTVNCEAVEVKQLNVEMEEVLNGKRNADQDLIEHRKI